MGIFDWWPYTNLHSLNTDWLVHVVRRFIDDSKVIFENQEEEIKWLKENFEALKIYVEEYFESLDVKEEINEIMDKWLEDGTIESLIEGPIVMFDKFYKQNFDGNLLLRKRRPRVYTPTNKKWTLQNGALYSPTGEYSQDNPDMRLYMWWITEDELRAEFKTFDMDNNEVNTVVLTNVAHAGPIVFKDNKAYSMNANRFLTVFNLQNPNAPVVESQRSLNLQSSYLIGTMGEYFVGLKQDIPNKELTLYKITSDFSSELIMFKLEGGLTGLFQDAVVDEENQLVYWLSYEPNVIHVHSLVNGKQVTQINVPDVIGYVAVGECEFVDVKNNILVLGSFQGVGTAVDNNLDYKVWWATPENMGNNSKQIPTNTAGTRDLIVRYQSIDGRYQNVDASVMGRFYFKYMEDAQNCAKTMNGGVTINVQEEYGEGWQLFTDCKIAFLSTAKTRPFNIDENVTASIDNLPGFIGGYMTQDYVKCYINQRDGSNITYNNLNLDPGNADVILYAEKCTVNILSAALIENIALYASVLNSPGGLGSKVYIANGIINVPFIDGAKYSTQYISSNTLLNGVRIQDGTSSRPTLATLCSEAIRSPKGFIVQPRTSSGLQYRPLETLWALKGADGGTAVTSGYYSTATGQYVNYQYTINRETITPPLSRFVAVGLVYYRFWLSTLTLPDNFQTLIALPTII